MLRILTLFIFSSLLVFCPTATSELIINQELLGKISAKYGSKAKRRALTLQQVMIKAKQAELDNEKLALINDFYNQHIKFIDDINHWGKLDYWATPLEFVASGAGDCEDYSIAKYFSLIEAGVAEKKLRLTYVKAIKLGQAHMVLTYFENSHAIPLVLDNLIPEIKKANQRNDLLPVYSFNGSGLWLAKTRGSGQRVGTSGRLSLWQKLKDKMLKGQL